MLEKQQPTKAIGKTVGFDKVTWEYIVENMFMMQTLKSSKMYDELMREVVQKIS
jgi:hypothetical protein